MTPTRYWSDTAIDLLAHRFKLLSEPSRLRLLYALQDGAKTVSDLIAITRMAQANVSHQLNLLAGGGLIVRRKAGQQVWYRLVDRSLVTLSDLVCQSLHIYGAEVLDALPHDRSSSDGVEDGA